MGPMPNTGEANRKAEIVILWRVRIHVLVVGLMAALNLLRLLLDNQNSGQCWTGSGDSLEWDATGVEGAVDTRHSPMDGTILGFAAALSGARRASDRSMVLPRPDSGSHGWVARSPAISRGAFLMVCGRSSCYPRDPWSKPWGYGIILYELCQEP